jgi:cytochrome c551/c552
VTLAHVGLAVVTFPIAAVWILVHVNRMRGLRPRQSRGIVLAQRTLTLAVILAALTGLLVIWGGTIIKPAVLHAACGVIVGLPLAWHLWLSSRQWMATGVVALLVFATGGSWAAKRYLPPKPVEAVTPEFAYKTRPISLFEPSSNCGECHIQDYEDWKHSTHARTLQLPALRESMERSKELLAEDLGHVGELLAGDRKALSAALVFGACGSCHAPTAFYGSVGPTPDQPQSSFVEGTGCAFCHTLREVRANRDVAEPAVIDPRTISREDIFALASRAPFYLSAPETVRRYIGQGSTNPIAHRVANWLIRWRPEIHSRDYHSPVLDDSRACLACHSLGVDRPDVPHMTYYGWQISSYNTGNSKTSVSCLDCHMARNMTGGQTREAARMVPWGPERSGVRSHLFLGGNAGAAKQLGDEPFAALQHAFASKGVSLSLARVERTPTEIEVTVSVRSELVGHFFPALETKLRYAWIELKALDASGKVIAATPRPKDSEDFGSASPLVMASVDDPKPDNERLVKPGSTRDFTGHLPLTAGAPAVAFVAELHTSVDPDPIATVKRALDAPVPRL